MSLTEQEAFAAPKPHRKKRKRPERKAQKDVVVWLVHHGFLVAVTDAGSSYGFKTGVPRGWPDLTCCSPSGRFVGIEMKAGTKQSVDQKFWQGQIEGNRGIYILAKSVADVEKALLKCNY